MGSQDEYKGYKEESYYNSNKEPFGITLKGKTKAFITAHANVKKMLKKQSAYQIKKNEIRVVDVTNNMGLFVAIVEVVGPNEEKGNVEIKVHAPGKKGATIELRKMSGFEYHYVELLKSIMTVFIDGFIAGDDIKDIINNSCNDNSGKKRVKIQPLYHYCDQCDFQSRFPQGLKAHKTKIHTKEKNVKCDKCDFVATTKNYLDIHEVNTHINSKKRVKFSITPTSSPPQKKHEGSQEKHAVKDDFVDASNVEMIDVEKEANDVVYNMLQERIDELEIELSKSEEKVSNLQKKNEENELKIKELKEKENEAKKNIPQRKETKIPNHLHSVRKEHLAKLRGYRMIFKSQPNGACLDNCAAVHIYEDVDEAPKLKKRLNNHIADHFDHYEQWISLPFTETVGVGEYAKSVTITSKEEMIQFLRSEDALMVYSNSQQILAMANLFNMNIYTFTYGSSNEGWSLVRPEPEMAKHAEIKFGKFIPDMALYHNNETHFDLLVSDDSRLALLGLLAGIGNEEEDVKNAEKSEGDWQKVKDNKKVKNKKVIMETKHDKEEKNCQEEMELLLAKQSGFSRTGPQTQSERKSNSNQIFTCDQCGLQFQSHGLLTAHVATHVEQCMFNCDFCEEIFDASNMLEKHIQNSHTKMKYNCESCEESFKDNSHLEEHMISKHIKPKNNCDDHDDKFLTNCQQEKHEIKEHAADEWNCNGCDFQADALNSLINHLKITGHQPSKSMDLKRFFSEYKQCYTCKMEFDGYYKLMDHRKGVHPSNKICNKFPNNCSRGKTCWYKHPDEPMDVDQAPTDTPKSAVFNCNLCGETIQEHKDFMKHKKMKHSDTILPCESFLKGMCFRNDDTCWFKHSPAEISYESTNKQEFQGFQEALPNAFPPDQRMFNMMCMRIEQVELKLQALSK